MSHTPGPWRRGYLLDTPATMKWTEKDRLSAQLKERFEIYAYFREEDQGRSRRLICTVQNIGLDSQDENASLIEAAPEMLGALQKAFVYIHMLSIGFSPEEDLTKDTLREIQAALERITPRTHPEEKG